MTHASRRSQSPFGAEDSQSSPDLDRDFRNKLLKVIYERQANCPHCDYSLDGLVGTRCPECGYFVEEYLRVVDTMPRRWSLLRRKIAERRLAAFSLLSITLFVAGAIAYIRFIY